MRSSHSIVRTRYGRVRASLPEHSMNARDIPPPANAFSYRFRVRPEDIDDLGHAGNVSWVRWVNVAATEHSLSVGLGLQKYQELGVVWVVRKHEIEYLAEALLNEEIEATTWVATLRGATSTRKTIFKRPRDDKLLARAETMWVLISTSTRRPLRIKKDLMQRYGFEPTAGPTP